MKIEVREGLIYSDSKAHTDAKGIVCVTVADEIAQANGANKAEGFVKMFDGKSFILDKKLKIKKEVIQKKGKAPVAAKTVKLPGTAKANGKYTFTETELRDMGKALAQKYDDREQIESEKKSVMSQFNERLDKVALDIGNLSRSVRNGYEFRDFICYVIIDWEAKTKTFYEAEVDTVIAVRALDPSDYQMKMEIDSQAAEEAAKVKKEKKEKKIPAKDGAK